MKNRNITPWILFLVGMGAACWFSGCSPERKELPTKGRTTMLISESVAPFMQQEKREFEDLYKDAKVDAKVMPTREAIVQFINVDSIKMIVTSRPLNAEERSVAKRYRMEFAEYKIALDGIAIITHRENPVKQLRTTQLDSILRGITTKWSQVGWKGSGLSIGICLPGQDAGEYEIVGTKILRGEVCDPCKSCSLFNRND